MILPAEGTAVERNRVDCKAKYADSDKAQRRAEMAKDVAAFANANGGRLLIGSVEQNGILTKHVGLDAADAQETRRDIEQAVRDFVRPPPVIDFPDPAVLANGKVVLFVDVEPFPGQAVGVRTGGSADDPWRFPVRVGTQTVWYSPEQLVLLMDVQYRRRVQMLTQLVGAKVVLHHGASLELSCEFLGIDEQTASVKFVADVGSGSGQRNQFSLPIDYVGAVWNSGSGWALRFRGQVLLEAGKQYAKVMPGTVLTNGGRNAISVE